MKPRKAAYGNKNISGANIAKIWGVSIDTLVADAATPPE